MMEELFHSTGSGKRPGENLLTSFVLSALQKKENIKTL